MEVALENGMPTYAGGLGVLAGDTLKAAADLKLPLVAVTLLHEEGYFDQHLDKDGNQSEWPSRWDPSKFMTLLPNIAEIKIEGRVVKLRAWKYEIKSVSGGVIPVFFLDANVDGNAPQDRNLTKWLYGGDQRYRLSQEIILGIGGVRLLDSLGFNLLDKFHMNEGHASLLTLELLNDSDGNPELVKDVCVFTTHTPVAAGHDHFSYDLVQQVLDTNEFHLDVIKRYGGDSELNTTRLALNLSLFSNAVAKKHSVVSENMFPGYDIKAITNGVHSNTWTCDEFAKLFDAYLEDWRVDSFNLRSAVIIPNDEVWNAHISAKKKLFDYVKAKTGVDMELDAFTMGFARRATGYKRAHLLFHDLDRLKSIVDNAGKIQVIFAGKAHPNDIEGKINIKFIFDVAKKLGSKVKVVFLENYDMDLAKMMVAGVDVWLNTPARPREASGTSGMKAAHNGVPNFSVLDGWWIEGHAEGITGWGIGPKPTEVNLDDKNNDDVDAKDIYNKLEYVILPIFYGRREEWIHIMKNSIAFNGSFFTTRRMLLQYVSKAYIR
jgi:glycogen phosphorylase